MPRKSTTKTTEAPATVDTNAVAESVLVDENKVTESVKTKSTIRKENVKPALEDSEEIEVVSLIPNVSYKDSKSGDIYEWDEVGHIEYMTVETLKNLWRNNKSYFRNMWLRPNDDRVIKKFGLTKVFEKYEFLMDESNYTRANISEVCDTISNTPNGLKYALCNKIKDLVSSGNISDAFVIKTLEKHLNLDLISFL